MKEEWKFILGYDNYMISSHGRVKSIFIYKWDRHNNTYKKCYREKITFILEKIDMKLQ